MILRYITVHLSAGHCDAGGDRSWSYGFCLQEQGLYNTELQLLFSMFVGQHKNICFP
jgi:hypothetical protein